MLLSILTLDSLSHAFSLLKSPFPYTSTNPTFSRLAFELFSLYFLFQQPILICKSSKRKPNFIINRKWPSFYIYALVYILAFQIQI